MSKKTHCLILFLILIICATQRTEAKTISNKYYKFTISLPVSMLEVIDSDNKVDGDVYYDTTTGIVLLISKTDSKFNSVKDYIDCSKQQLEKELQNNYSDTTLRLISCNKSQYYPDKTVLLNIEVGVLPSGFNQSLIYFIHHKKKDIQFSFMLKKGQVKTAMVLIDSIMKTLRLI